MSKNLNVKNRFCPYYILLIFQLNHGYTIQTNQAYLFRYIDVYPIFEMFVKIIYYSYLCLF